MTHPFSRKAALGTPLEDKPHHQTKGIYLPLPLKLAGFGKVDSESSKKLYKVEAENVPSLCLP